MSEIKALTKDKLYTACDLSRFDFKTTSELGEVTGMIGQDRAVDAMEFGIGIKRKGYNLFVLGPGGFGKHSMVKHYLTEQEDIPGTVNDWGYVANFQNPQKPIAICFPCGKGIQFKNDMAQMVEELRTAIPAAFESEQYQTRFKEIQDSFQEQTREAFMELSKEAEKHNVGVIRTHSDISFVPEKNGKALTEEEYQKLSAEDKEKYEQVIAVLEEKLEQIFLQRPQWQREIREKIKDLNREVGMFAVGHLIDELKEKYGAIPKLGEYLDNLQNDVINNLHLFREPELMMEGKGQLEVNEPYLRRYQVNLMVDNSEHKKVPVIYEDNPTLPNLTGKVEYLSQMGTLVTDYMLVKPGALHKANGGYLILDADKVLLQPFAWNGLKRALSSNCINIQSIGELFGLISTVSLEPQPIPLDVKVVLVGERILYYLLCEYDQEFADLFKVAADFEETILRTEENSELYAKLIATLVHKEELLEFDVEAVARVIEHGARLADDSGRLSTHMLSIVDLLREADYWAQHRKATIVSREDVQKAIDKQIYRSDRYRSRLQEEIVAGTLLIDCEGEKVAQVNGLFVVEMGKQAFGQPARITATARIGEGEVLDIEREVDLGGSIHSKGVLILSSFMAARYAHNFPLSLSASLVFEQSYGQVEGDSATVGELCALLSALANTPVKQSLAVTGSANQHGQVQAIGGVNEKIEGFFDVCNAKGLTGEQGVIIPASNVPHLMLRDDVVEAAEKGMFHIYPVSYVDEAIELLTGIPAGVADEKGEFPEDTINFRVNARLEEMAMLKHEFAKSDDEHKEEKHEDEKNKTEDKGEE